MVGNQRFRDVATLLRQLVVFAWCNTRGRKATSQHVCVVKLAYGVKQLKQNKKILLMAGMTQNFVRVLTAAVANFIIRGLYHGMRGEGIGCAIFLSFERFVSKTKAKKKIMDGR